MDTGWVLPFFLHLYTPHVNTKCPIEPSMRCIAPRRMQSDYRPLMAKIQGILRMSPIVLPVPLFTSFKKQPSRDFLAMVRPWVAFAKFSKGFYKLRL